MKKRIRRKLGEGEFCIPYYHEFKNKIRWMTREEAKKLLIIADWHDNIKYCTKQNPMPEDGMSGRHSQQYHWIHKDAIPFVDEVMTNFNSFECPYCGTKTHKSK